MYDKKHINQRANNFQICTSYYNKHWKQKKNQFYNVYDEIQRAEPSLHVINVNGIIPFLI